MSAPRRTRSFPIRVMVSAQERGELRRAAERSAMPVSVYVRSAALEKARKDVDR